MVNDHAPTTSADAERKRKAVEYTRQWKIDNPDRRKHNDAAYRERNREALRAKGRDYDRSHPIERKARKHVYLGRKYGADGSYTAAEIRRLIAAYDNKCAYCSVPLDRVELDHRIPLTRGGTNYIDNLVPACRRCNASKNDRTEEEFRAPNPLKRIIVKRDPTIPLGYKLCRPCGRILPYSDYWKMSSVKTGIYSTCKPCSAKKHKDYISRNRDHRRAYMREWYRKHTTTGG